MVRELEARVPLDVAILSERRARRPFGLAGGEPGASGINTHHGRALPGRVSFRALTGQRFSVETPGGGGHGTPTG